MSVSIPDDVPMVDAAALRQGVVADIFRNAERWEINAAHAALYRFRPHLRRAPESEAEIAWHEVHMSTWHRNPNYFNRVCRFLAAYGVGDGVGTSST